MNTYISLIFLLILNVFLAGCGEGYYVNVRPGSEKVKIEEELKRVLPILNNISNLKNKVPISLDTRKPEVMKKGLKKGVDIINDVSGLRYSRDTIPLLKKTKSPIVIMHSISTPKLMQKKISYKIILIVQGSLLIQELALVKI